MKKIGIGIDYSNICKNYNTAYLDRDNKDPETSKCMKAVVAWTHEFLSELCGEFGYGVYTLNAATSVKIDEVASNRFLFFSLEKGITLQSYVVQKEHGACDTATQWAKENRDGLLIQNDEDGEGVYLYFEENSELHRWITGKLESFTLDEVPFPSK